MNRLLFRIRTGVRWRDPPKMSPPGAQRGGAPSEANSSVPHRPCEGSQHGCRAGAALWEWVGRAPAVSRRRPGPSSPAPAAFAKVFRNAPYYARPGFRALAETELTDGLREVLAEEAALGPDRRPRVCVKRGTT
ncbi:hypothetical protein ACFYXP_32640 [Streptomyces sp. NPDC002466]|uniref:hypothetical protein n=1 Tax=Streptomyces sp. NPDC002466 TaxID=3364646 RepID=UPI0036C938FE